MGMPLGRPGEAWEGFGIPQEDQESVAGERDLRTQSRISGKYWMEGSEVSLLSVRSGLTVSVH